MNPYLSIALPLAPIGFRRIIEAIPASRWDESLDGSRFTPREVIAHLADWEPIFLERLQTGVNNPGSTLTTYDIDQRSAEKGYGNTDMAEQLRRFSERRGATIAYIQDLSAEDFSKEVVHPERGRMTVGDVANMIVGHDSYHYEQLTAYLAEKSAGTW